MNVYDFDQTIFYPDSSCTFFLYCLKKYPGAVLRVAEHPLGVERKPVKQPGPVSPSPKHPREKRGEHQRERERKEEVVDDPLHLIQILAPSGRSSWTLLPAETTA